MDLELWFFKYIRILENNIRKDILNIKIFSDIIRVILSNRQKPKRIYESGS